MPEMVADLPPDEQDRFSLRSVGPDGKPNTPDDIVVSGPTP